MPEYPFRTTDGRVVHVTIPMKEAPCIGAELIVGGERLVRLPSQVRTNTTPTRRFPYTSHTLPLNLKGETHDRGGFTVVRDKQHEERLAKTYGYDIA